MVTENLLQNILDADTRRKRTEKKKKRKLSSVQREQSAAEKKKKKLSSVQQSRRRMGRDMGVGPSRIDAWVVRTQWLEARNGCHMRGTRIVMRISSKLVVHDTIWWDHETWS